MAISLGLSLPYVYYIELQTSDYLFLVYQLYSEELVGH